MMTAGGGVLCMICVGVEPTIWIREEAF